MNYVKPYAMPYGKFLLKVWKEGRKEQSAEGTEAESCSGMLIQDMPDESREIKTKKMCFCFVLFSLIRTFEHARRYFRSTIKTKKIVFLFCIVLTYSYLCRL